MQTQITKEGERKLALLPLNALLRACMLLLGFCSSCNCSGYIALNSALMNSVFESKAYTLNNFDKVVLHKYQYLYPMLLSPNDWIQSRRKDPRINNTVYEDADEHHADKLSRIEDLRKYIAVFNLFGEETVEIHLKTVYGLGGKEERYEKQKKAWAYNKNSECVIEKKCDPLVRPIHYKKEEGGKKPVQDKAQRNLVQSKAPGTLHKGKIPAHAPRPGPVTEENSKMRHPFLLLTDLLYLTAKHGKNSLIIIDTCKTIAGIEERREKMLEWSNLSTELANKRRKYLKQLRKKKHDQKKDGEAQEEPEMPDTDEYKGYRLNMKKIQFVGLQDLSPEMIEVLFETMQFNIIMCLRIKTVFNVVPTLLEKLQCIHVLKILIEFSDVVPSTDPIGFFYPLDNIMHLEGLDNLSPEQIEPFEKHKDKFFILNDMGRTLDIIGQEAMAKRKRVADEMSIVNRETTYELNKKVEYNDLRIAYDRAVKRVHFTKLLPKGAPKGTLPVIEIPKEEPLDPEDPKKWRSLWNIDDLAIEFPVTKDSKFVYLKLSTLFRTGLTRSLITLNNTDYAFILQQKTSSNLANLLLYIMSSSEHCMHIFPSYRQLGGAENHGAYPPWSDINIGLEDNTCTIS